MTIAFSSSVLLEPSSTLSTSRVVYSDGSHCFLSTRKFCYVTFLFWQMYKSVLSPDESTALVFHTQIDILYTAVEHLFMSTWNVMRLVEICPQTINTIRVLLSFIVDKYRSIFIGPAYLPWGQYNHEDIAMTNPIVIDYALFLRQIISVKWCFAMRNRESKLNNLLTCWHCKARQDSHSFLASHLFFLSAGPLYI